jgi:geranylgeranyl reductase family protein
MAVRRYDAIVVGAGPAGSSTAFRLASGGASVLLLDRARFPRDKPCGGGVTPRALAHVPVPIESVVERVPAKVELRLGFRRAALRGCGGPLVHMTQRRRLDALLVEHAGEAGAEVRDGVRVTGIEPNGAGVVVTAGGERLHGRTVVGADGVNGIAARSLGLGGNRELGVALEGNLPNAKADLARYAGRFVMELGTVPGGYGWVFPKGEHLNVGVGGAEGEGPRLRKHLERLCEAHGIRVADLEDVRGHRLPFRAPDSTLARGPALVAGDAAGLVDPLTGDGMFEAFLSGRFAAEAIVAHLAGEADSLEPYAARLTRHLAVHLWAAWSLRAALDRFPRTTYALAKSAIVWPVVEKLVTGELPDIRATRGLARPPLKLLALLARAAGDPGHAYKPA